MKGGGCLTLAVGLTVEHLNDGLLLAGLVERPKVNTQSEAKAEDEAQRVVQQGRDEENEPGHSYAHDCRSALRGGLPVEHTERRRSRKV